MHKFRSEQERTLSEIREGYLKVCKVRLLLGCVSAVLAVHPAAFPPRLASPEKETPGPDRDSLGSHLQAGAGWAECLSF